MNYGNMIGELVLDVVYVSTNMLHDSFKLIHYEGSMRQVPVNRIRESVEEARDALDAIEEELDDLEASIDE